MLVAKTVKFRGIETTRYKQFHITDRGSLNLDSIFETKPISSVLVKIQAITDVNISVTYYKDSNKTSVSFIETYTVNRSNEVYLLINIVNNVTIDINGSCDIELKAMRINSI